MSRTERPLLAWVGLSLLATLVGTNAVFLALSQTGGPLVGLVLYAVLLWRWRQGDYRAAVVGGLAGLAVHVAEVVVSGWSAYPVLMLPGTDGTQPDPASSAGTGGLVSGPASTARE